MGGDLAERQGGGEDFDEDRAHAVARRRLKSAARPKWRSAP
jgi:hypothetical protein